MGFKTLHPDNSIYQVRMAVHTGGPLAEAERKQLTSEAKKGWLNILPSVEVAQVINVQLQANDPAVLQQKPVMALAPTVYGQYGMDGTPILQMELKNNTVALMSTRYSRWDAVSGKFYKLLTMLGRVVPEGHPFRKVSSVELTYIDRLGWEGERHGIQAEQAVQEKYLPEDRKPEEMWHSEQGWTTKEPDGVNIMEKWNVARVNRPVHGGEEAWLQLITTAVWGFGNSPGNSAFDLHTGYSNLQAIDTPPTGKTVGEILHRRAKRLYGAIVTPAIAKQVGLNDPERS